MGGGRSGTPSHRSGRCLRSRPLLPPSLEDPAGVLFSPHRRQRGLRCTPPSERSQEAPLLGGPGTEQGPTLYFSLTLSSLTSTTTNSSLTGSLPTHTTTNDPSQRPDPSLACTPSLLTLRTTSTSTLPPPLRRTTLIWTDRTIRCRAIGANGDKTSTGSIAPPMSLMKRMRSGRVRHPCLPSPLLSRWILSTSIFWSCQGACAPGRLPPNDSCPVRTRRAYGRRMGPWTWTIPSSRCRYLVTAVPLSNPPISSASVQNSGRLSACSALRRSGFAALARPRSLVSPRSTSSLLDLLPPPCQRGNVYSPPGSSPSASLPCLIFDQKGLLHAPRGSLVYSSYPGAPVRPILSDLARIRVEGVRSSSVVYSGSR